MIERTDDVVAVAVIVFFAVLACAVLAMLIYVAVSLITGHPIDQSSVVTICEGKGCR